MENNLTYTRNGDYLIPDLKLSEQPEKMCIRDRLKDGRTHVTGLYSEKSGRTYDATVVLEDTGQYVNFKLEFDRQKGGGK